MHLDNCFFLIQTLRQNIIYSILITGRWQLTWDVTDIWHPTWDNTATWHLTHQCINITHRIWHVTWCYCYVACDIRRHRHMTSDMGCHCCVTSHIGFAPRHRNGISNSELLTFSETFVNRTKLSMGAWKRKKEYVIKGK